MSKEHQLLSISPVDGRYNSKVSALSNYFSEYALIRYRVLIEVEYFIALCRIPLPGLEKVSNTSITKLRKIYTEFSMENALEIKEIESTTNHDVKAVEYFLKDKMKTLKLGETLEFVHFGLTSQDINNTAIPLSLRHFCEDVYYPKIESLIDKINALAEDWKDITMLARTHGQPASPTRLGKEFKVFSERLEKQLRLLKEIPYACKFGGATGNFNAHHIAYPKVNWRKFANQFTSDLGLTRSETTTQIEHYDMLAAWCDGMKRINNIIIDLNRDIWSYISMDYFKQKLKKGEIGSSAMPHKVNPIDFENSEGNLGIANALFEHFAAKLPISRLQRDLTDSTVLRNLGVAPAHSIISVDSTLRGLDKLLLNKQAIDADLENNWAVVAEAIQTVLRREAYPNPYEKLKELTRGQKIDAQSIKNFIESLDVNKKIKAELLKINPHNYTGI
jgi:adenylosuccinate lyase